ncbi:MAG: LVIVD repeat-containing protein [Candidatus Thorarchaeota archaeon]
MIKYSVLKKKSILSILLLLFFSVGYIQLQSNISISVISTVDNSQLTIQTSEDVFTDYGYEYLGCYDNNYNNNYYPEFCYPINNLLFVAADNILEIIYYADSKSPQLLGTYEANTTIHSILACNNYVFLTKQYSDFSLDDGLGFEIINVTDPTNPQQVTFFNNFTEILPSHASSGSLALDSSHNILYVVNDGGLGIVDVSNVANPVLLGEISFSFNMFDTIIYEDSVIYALLSRRDWGCNGLGAWNVSSSSSPCFLWGFGGFDSAGSFYISDNYLYVNFESSINIYIIEENKSISLEASHPCEFSTQMLVKENVMYLCQSYNLVTSDVIHVLNITNKELIEEVFTYDCSESTSKITHLAIYSNKLFISETNAGTKYFIIPYCSEENDPFCDCSFTTNLSVLSIPLIFTGLLSLAIFKLLLRKRKSN